MPILLLIIIAVGLGLGASFFGGAGNPQDAQTLTVEKLYTEPTPETRFVTLTDGKLNLSASFVYRKRSGSSIYVGLVPQGADATTKAKVLLLSNDVQDVAFFSGKYTSNPAPSLAETKYPLERAGTPRRSGLRPALNLTGKLALPSPGVAEVVSTKFGDVIEKDFIVFDPEAVGRAELNSKVGAVLLVAGTVASVLFLCYVVGPKTQLMGQSWKKDKRGIIGSDGLSDEELFAALVNKRARIVSYAYAFSVIIVSARRNSELYYKTGYFSGLIQSLPYNFVTLCCGWWGIPWGPIYTLGSVGINLAGGKDMTKEYLAALQQPPGTNEVLPPPHGTTSVV